MIFILDVDAAQRAVTINNDEVIDGRALSIIFCNFFMNRFLEKTIGNISSAFFNSLYAQESVRKSGLLQKLSPWVKLVCSFILLLAVSISRRFPYLLFVYFFLLILANLSKISLRVFISRVWLFLPFFTGIVVFPLIFNFLSPGRAIVVLLDIPSYNFYLSITFDGLSKALLILFRVAASVSIMTLLVITTRWADLLKSLQILHLGEVFVTILGMTYRYIFVFLQITANMILARKSRLVGKVRNREDRAWVGGAIGTLFGKSFVLSEEVYQSMQSRGYRGKVETMNNITVQKSDIISLVCSMLLLLFILFLK